MELGLDAAGSFDDGLALDGELAGAALDEDDPELALEPGNVGRDVGLDGVQRAGGGRKAGVIGHCDQGSELSKIHRL